MFNWFDSRKKTLPVQVLENRNDIDVLKQYIAYTYGYNGELTTDTTSCPQGSTDVPNNTTYGFLIDNVGHVFKILGVASSIVTIKYYATVTGPKGDVGQGYNEMGEWTSSNEYHPYDVVSYNGSSYVCVAEVHNSDIPPSQDATHWTIFALGANMYELIYDKDTKNTIGGTAYTNGVKFGANTNINVAGYSKIKTYSRVYNTYAITEVVIDKTGWTGNSFMIFDEASAIKNVGILIYHAGASIIPAECFNFSDGTGLNNNDNAYVYRIEGVK